MSPRKAPSQEPQILEMPPQKMAVVKTVGNPNEAAQQAFPALYGSVYTLKFARKKQGQDFKMSPPRARWPMPFDTPVDQWVGLWALPVPDDVTELPQKTPGTEVKLETWEYGTVAQILHVGAYSEEMLTIARLRAFVAQQGYEIAGPHEEEYLSRPDAKVPKTLIRYQVRQR